MGIYFTLRNETDTDCNSWAFIDNVQVQPEVALHKTSDPSGPVHEGDVITYTISYSNTGLVTQTGMVITDQVPIDTELVTTSLYNATFDDDRRLVRWPPTGTLPPLAVGESGTVSFQVQIPLLPPTPPDASTPPPLTITPTPSGPFTPPASRAVPQPVQPHPISCQSTTFWMAGISDQSGPTTPFTTLIDVPAGSRPSQLWIVGKEDAEISSIESMPAPAPILFGDGVNGQLWRMALSDAVLDDGKLEIITETPASLSAILLYEGETSPFPLTNPDARWAYTQSYTYSLRADFPNVPVTVELPIIDVRFWRLNSDVVDTRVTTVTVQVDDNERAIALMHPNAGNGLRLESFPFADLPAGTHTLHIRVDTQDSLYFLSPHICRSPLVLNTAYVCSDQVGCLAATAINNGLGIYLPIILKSHR